MLFNAFLIALREIRRNVTRAFLTVLGIIIGVSAVITMVTVGQGATEAVRQQISSLGSNLVSIVPGVGFGPGMGSAGAPPFTETDVRAIAEQIYGVAAVAPVRSVSLSTIYLDQARTTPVVGTTTAYFTINRWTLAAGRFFTEADQQSAAAVAVIGDTARRELFGDEDPVGRKLRVGKASLEIIGVLAAKGQAGMGNQDNTLIVPLETLQRRLVGQTSARTITQISVSAAEGTDSAALISDLTSLMRERRGLQGNEENNFNVFDTRQIAATLSASTQMMTLLLTGVAGISLLVGGVGIMNIMLVSVTERTREIGIRLSIGATAREVRMQFLIEAVTLSSVGGLIGIAVGFVLCLLLSSLISVGFVFNAPVNLLAFLFSAAVGVIFGFTPARRAARLDPIQALRHE